MSQHEELLCETSRFRVVRRKQPIPGHGVLAREIIVHPGAVTIIPLLDDGRVCLIRNFRAAVNETLIELPAGTLEPQEPPLGTAIRELAEETGYRAKHVEKIHEFYMSPGIMNERMHLFVATGLTLGETNLDEGEQIEVQPTEWTEAMAMVDDGRIQDAKTLVGLLTWDRLRDR